MLLPLYNQMGWSHKHSLILRHTKETRSVESRGRASLFCQFHLLGSYNGKQMYLCVIIFAVTIRFIFNMYL